MIRTSITVDELNDWIRKELAREPECQGIQFEGRFNRLTVDSPEQCNWSTASVRGDAGGYSSRCLAHLQKVLAVARRKFDLKEE